MRGDDRYDRALVIAARDGDRGPVDRLVAAYLPLVYNVVGRALDGHADVDDVVQETMLRCVDGLRGAARPGRASGPGWSRSPCGRCASGTGPARRRRRATRLGATTSPDPGADFADLTILRLELSGQRREVAEATRWLDPDDRELLSLWWLEAVGRADPRRAGASLGVTTSTPRSGSSG